MNGDGVFQKETLEGFGERIGLQLLTCLSCSLHSHQVGVRSFNPLAAASIRRGDPFAEPFEGSFLCHSPVVFHPGLGHSHLCSDGMNCNRYCYNVNR